MLASWYAIAPIPPEGLLFDEYIEQRWEAFPLAQGDQPEWVPTCANWLPILQNERELELRRYFSPYTMLRSTATTPSTASSMRPSPLCTHAREVDITERLLKKASPPCAPPRIVHRRAISAVSTSWRPRVKES
jgi:hypothetical protein